MKTSYILSIFTALCLSVSILAAIVNTSTLKTKADGDSKSVKSNTKEITSGYKASNTTTALAENDFAYLRFDVTKYTNQDLDITNEANAKLNLIDNEFIYLKFDVSRYVNKDNPSQEGKDTNMSAIDNDFSYLKFDVTKYAGNDEDYAGETMNP